jgi:hypothetical protein
LKGYANSLLLQFTKVENREKRFDCQGFIQLHALAGQAAGRLIQKKPSILTIRFPARHRATPVNKNAPMNSGHSVQNFRIFRQ